MTMAMNYLGIRKKGGVQEIAESEHVEVLN